MPISFLCMMHNFKVWSMSLSEGNLPMKLEKNTYRVDSVYGCCDKLRLLLWRCDMPFQLFLLITPNKTLPPGSLLRQQPITAQPASITALGQSSSHSGWAYSQLQAALAGVCISLSAFPGSVDDINSLIAQVAIQNRSFTSIHSSMLYVGFLVLCFFSVSLN